MQAWDRYAYVNNSPVKFVDPTGHMLVSEGPDNDKFSQWKADQYKSEKEQAEEEKQEASEDPKLPYKGDPTPNTDNQSTTSICKPVQVAAGGFLILAGAAVFAMGAGVAMLGVADMTAGASVGGIIHGGMAVGVGVGMATLGALGAIEGGYMIYKSGCIPGIK